MASLYVKYPKTCRNKKSSVYLTPPISSISSISSSGSLSSSDDNKASSSSSSSSGSQLSKRKQNYYHQHYTRSHKVLTLPKRKKLKFKKSPPSTTTTSSDSDTNKFNECRPFINNNAQDEINRNSVSVSLTCKTITLFLYLVSSLGVFFSCSLISLRLIRQTQWFVHVWIAFHPYAKNILFSSYYPFIYSLNIWIMMMMVTKSKKKMKNNNNWRKRNYFQSPLLCTFCWLTIKKKYIVSRKVHVILFLQKV